jgi:hypothetical protein
MRILIMQTLFPKTSPAFEGWARKVMEAEIQRALQQYQVARKSVDKANHAVDSGFWGSTDLGTVPSPALQSLPRGIGWLFYGFERGAVAPADVLWALRNVTETINARTEANARFARADADLVCISGLSVDSVMRSAR